MLVLSRRPGQKVVFPSLGITIDVLRSRGTVVRLGIDAPKSVAILRDEVVKSDAEAGVLHEAEQIASHDEKSHQDWRNQLNLLVQKLQLLQRQLESGESVDLEHCLEEALSELSLLEKMTTDAAVVPPSSPRVLIVEDQANERELLATCLRLGGFEVATAGNGREAFDYLHDHDLPDLVLLDMRMPDVDGPTFIRSVRNDFRLHDLRVFAVTGSSRNEFESEPLPLDGWISKPVRIDALIQAVRKDHASGSTRV